MPVERARMCHADANTNARGSRCPAPDAGAPDRRTPKLKIIRRALGLTQEEFARRFQIPLGTLRDWEQGAAQPDQTARAYLRAIAGDAAAVQRALEVATGR